MAFTAYVDDSGSEPSSPLYVLGGVCLPTAWWGRVTDKWNGVLRADPKVAYFKAAEVWERDLKKDTPFVNLSDAERRRKVDVLVETLRDHHTITISNQMEWKVFREFKSKHELPIGKNDPYFYLYYGTISLMALWGERESCFDTVDFVFDNHNKIGEQVKAWYPTFKNACSPKLQSFLGQVPDFKDEKDEVPLQAADLVAWYARRNALSQLHDDWHNNMWTRLTSYCSQATIGMEQLENIWEMVNGIEGL